MTRVRVLTWNILMGGRRGQPVVEVLRAVAADVVLVNEAPKLPVVWRWRCRRLARRAGLRYVTGGRSAGSNLLLVAPGIDVVRSGVEVLPQPFGQPRRGIVSARLTVRGQAFAVVGCHLSLDAARRVEEVRRVLEVAGDMPDPVVVAGDLNERPDGPSWERLREAGFVDHGDREWRTFPADRPDRRIDALLVRGGVRVPHHGDPGVPEELLAAASDHRPVLAVLDL